MNVAVSQRRGSTFSVVEFRRRRSVSRLLAVGLLIVALCVGPARPCGPGRGAGQRRGPRKMTPLVFKQHVPNVSEHTLGASGPAEGRITRSDTKFKDLVVNANPDIVFKDEEGTGADRIMSQRCRDKLNTLAVLVMNQWPGVRLRVTQTWTEQPGNTAANPAGGRSGQQSLAAATGNGGGSQSSTSTGGDSLHYEGRAVDVTTSDRDRTKYGMLARLAVEAGFDWVYYESRSHIHCSVKSDSSIAASYGGCFPGHAMVRLESGGTVTMDELSVGDRVMTFDSDSGLLKFDTIVAFIHRSELAERGTIYQTVVTAGGHSLTLTPGHLIYASPSPNADITKLQPIHAGDLQVGDFVFVSASVDIATENKTTSPSAVKITRIDVYTATSYKTSSSSSTNGARSIGIYAPLTSTGNIVVDDVVTSCYAAFGSHRVAHAVMWPLIYARRLASVADRWMVPLSLFSLTDCDERPSLSGSECMHWYAAALRTVTTALLPRSLWYNGNV